MCLTLTLVCDDVRCGGDHVAYLLDLYRSTRCFRERTQRCRDGEEWDLDLELKVIASRGWYDAADYERQTEDSDA